MAAFINYDSNDKQRMHYRSLKSSANNCGVAIFKEASESSL